MNTFLSILSVPVRPESEEKIALGIFLSDGENSLFNYSGDKLSLLKDLIDEVQHKFIRNYLKAIERVTSKKEEANSQISIPDVPRLQELFINEPSFEYMSIYNRNMAVFSKPVKIDLPVNDEIFARLFEKYIDTIKVSTKKILNQVQRTKESFLPEVIAHFTGEKELTEKDFPGIVIPLKVDLSGKNETPVYAQFLDLERKLLTFIKNDYYDLKELKRVIGNGKGFLVTAEPDKELFIKQHNIWSNIRDANEFEIVDVSEVEMINKYAAEHEVRPWE